MSFLSFFSKRNKEETVVNPCPIPQDNDASVTSLSNLLKQQKAQPMALSAFFAAINLIANTLASVKWLFKYTDDEPLDNKHYLYHIFDYCKISRFIAIKNVVKDILLYGNGFLYIERDDATGQPITVQYSPANQTSMYYNPLTQDLYYMNPTFSTKWDNGDNYLHFYINSEDGFQGRSIPSYAYKTINLSQNTEKSANDYYSSGGRLFGIISVDGTLPTVGTKDKQLQQLRQSWDEASMQSNGTGTIFIPANLKYTALASNAKDSAMIESRLFNVQEIARFFNISPTLLGDYSHNYYNSLSEAQMAFLIYTIEPYIKMFESELNRKLIMPSKRSIEYIDLDENSILAIDTNKQAEYLSKLTTSGLMTANEARKILGLKQIEGGDKLTVAYSDVGQNTINKSEDEEDEQQ